MWLITMTTMTTAIQMPRLSLPLHQRGAGTWLTTMMTMMTTTILK
jgi:hypothetical protein